MQRSVPELTDLSTEDPATLEMYGPDVKKPGSFAASALLARRLTERGVRVGLPPVVSHHRLPSVVPPGQG